MGPASAAPFEMLFFIWLCCVGACVGSFLNVVVFRLPRRCLSVSRPRRSFCPRCRRALRWYENVPILSWLALRARCAGCRQPISWRYPLLELATLVLFGWLFWRDVAGRIDDPAAWGVFVVHAAFACGLGVCALIDLELRIIPDEIDIAGILLLPPLVFVLPELMEGRAPDLAGSAAWLVLQLDPALAWWGLGGLLAPIEALATLPEARPELHPHLAALGGSLAGAALGAGFVYAVGAGFSRMLGAEAMGFGDVKLMGMIGALVGWEGVVVTLFVACVVGAAGGLVYLVLTGRRALSAGDLRGERSLLGRLGIALCVAAPGPVTGGVPAAAGEDADAPIPIRPGTSLIARLLTGDPYVPFGPFLALGGFLAAFWPGLLPWLLAGGAG